MKRRRVRIITYWCGLMVVLLLSRPAGAAATYESELQRVKEFISAGRHVEADALLSRLLVRYQENAELFGLRGRVRVWLGKRPEGLDDLRRALAIREDSEVRAVLMREETDEQLARARSLLESGVADEALKLVLPIFQRGSARYGAGLLVARSYAALGDLEEASQVYGRLHDEFPADHELSWLYVRSLLGAGYLEKARAVVAALPEKEEVSLLLARANVALRSGLPREAAGLFRRVLALREDGEVLGVVAGLEKGIALGDADELFFAGKQGEAERILRPLFEREGERYEAGTRLVRIHRSRKDFVAAAEILAVLRSEAPADGELLFAHVDVFLDGGRATEALQLLDEYREFRHLPPIGVRRARALYRMRKFHEAVNEYLALEGVARGAVAEELEAAQEAAIMAETVALMRTGRVAEAEAIWSDIFPGRRDRNRDVYKLGMKHMKNRNFERAAFVFACGSRAFPEDTGFWALEVESRILEGDVPAAAELVAAATPERRKYLEREREDLLYRSKPNSMRVSVLAAAYDNGLPAASEVAVTFARRQRNLSFSVTGGAYTRYGSTEVEAGGEVTVPLYRRSLRGTFALTVAPGGEFLPQVSARGEATLALKGGYEASVGYTHMSFRSSEADIIVLGGLGYLTGELTLAERLYLVPSSGSIATTTTLHYEKHRYRAYYTLGLGTASETLRDAQGQLNYFTFSNRVGAEYRPVAEWSGGGELFQEFRQSLYSRYGGQVFLKYWW